MMGEISLVWVHASTPTHKLPTNIPEHPAHLWLYLRETCLSTLTSNHLAAKGFLLQEFGPSQNDSFLNCFVAKKSLAIVYPSSSGKLPGSVRASAAGSEKIVEKEVKWVRTQ